MTVLNFASPAYAAPRHAAPPPVWQSAVPVRDPAPAAADNAWAFLVEGLDSLAHGVALLDADGALLYANLAARQLFAQAGWQVGAALRSARPGIDGEWRAALRQCAAQGRRLLFELSHDDAEAPQYVALAPVVLAGCVRVFVTGGRRELCGQPELQLYATRRGLTGAENQVLCKLARGMQPAQIAQAHGVALSTVLTQVAAVRAKTMSTSIKHLLATLSRLPPLRPLLG
jgi:DNA-binding CsgD family transcriptional regulator